MSSLTIMDAWVLLLLANIFVAIVIATWRSLHDISVWAINMTGKASGWLGKLLR